MVKTKEEQLKNKLDRQEEINKMLVENFTSLQKVLTHLSARFDSLSENISRLLLLFEMSARSFAEKQPVKDLEKDKEFLDKLNTLMEQNKTIAKGLTLMEEKMRERLYGSSPIQEARVQPSERMQSGIMDAGNPSLKKLPKF